MDNITQDGQYKRLNFFTGFFTTADDWNNGEKYHLEKRKLHNRGLHTPGIIPNQAGAGESLEVTAAGEMSIRVSPGTALDGAGNLIYLHTAYKLEVEKPAPPPEPSTECTHHTRYVAIRFSEKSSDFVSNVQDPDYSGYTRVTEEPQIELICAEPTGFPWIELARVTVCSNTMEITDQDIVRSHRKYAGAVDPARDAQLETIQEEIGRLEGAVKQRIIRTHQYHLQKARRHNRGLHTPGVLGGVGEELKVQATGGLTLRIGTGAALDGEGNELYLAVAHLCTIEKADSARRIYIAIKYNDNFTGFLKNLEQQFGGVFTTAEVIVTGEAPDNVTLIELARIDLEAGVEEIQEQQIDQRHRLQSGSIGVAPPCLPLALQARIRAVMQTKRDNFARLAVRFPHPSVDDVRTAALQLQMSVDVLRPDQLLPLLAGIANLEDEVKRKLCQIYPPLVHQPEFRAYQDAVAKLLDAIRQGQLLEELLTLQSEVSNAALRLADVVLQPPSADAGPDQYVETPSLEAKVTLDASGSRAAGEHTIVRYRWENLTARTSLIDTDQPIVEVTLPLGVHLLRLVVEDNTHLHSEPDTVVITVVPSEITCAGINPNEGRRGATIDAVIFGKNLQHATAVKVYRGAEEDTRVKVTIRQGGTAEELPVTIKISDHAALGPRTFEVVAAHGRATVLFAVVSHEAPIILGIEPVWASPSRIHPIPARIEGEHLEQARRVTFLHHGKEDPSIQTIIRRANPEYLDVDLTISANAEYGRRRFVVSTPAGTTESPPNVSFTVVPGYLSSAVIVLTVITALIHLFLDFPNALFLLNGLGYLALLAGLYAPTSWLFTGLRPMMRWVLLVYALLSIVTWIAIGERTGLAYFTKAVEVLLVLLLIVESRQR